MNFFAKSALALRVATNQAWKAGRMAFHNPRRGRAVLNRYEAGLRFQFGERSFLWSYVTDARFDANQATRIELVRKARYFEQNSPLVQRLCDIFEQYVVGANGLVMSADSSNEDWNQAAQTWFDEWSVYPDLTSLQSWSMLQGLIARTWFIDGEVFIIKTRGETPPYRPRLQLVEGHRVATPGGFTSAEGTQLVDGVEIDAKGRPIAYWIQTGFNADNFTRVDAADVIHIFEPSRIAQYRGMTPFYAVMNDLHDLDDLGRMEMAKAKKAADTTDIIKTPTGEVLDDAADFDRQHETGDIADIGQKNPLAEYYQRVFGPTTKVMKIGDEYEVPSINNPTTSQQWYWRYKAEQICNGVGIPIVLVYPDSMQGTVYRGTLDVANAQFRARSAVLGGFFKQVWIYSVGTGCTQDRRLTGRPFDWTKLTARPPRAVNADVGRNSSAMLSEWRAGSRTLQSICAETGDDWKGIIRQKAREIAEIKARAIEYMVEANDVSDAIAPAIAPPIPTDAPGGQTA